MAVGAALADAMAGVGQIRTAALTTVVVGSLAVGQDGWEDGATP